MKCNICGNEELIVVDEEQIYGKSYSNRKCLMCSKCGAYVGLDDNNKPLGILADKEMRALRKECHNIFDTKWKTNKERKQRYYEMSKMLNIPFEKCHFGMFDKEQLKNALNWLKGEL